MSNKYKKIVSLLLVALLSACVCGTALAQAPDSLGRLNSDIWSSESVCAQNADQSSPSASSTADSEAVNVKLHKGELTLYDAENRELAKLNIAEEGDTFGTILKKDQTGYTAGNVTYQKSYAQLLRTTEIEGEEVSLVPIRVVYPGPTPRSDAFDAYINLQHILNIEELALAYQGWYPAAPAETEDQLNSEIYTKLSEVDESVKDVIDGSRILSSSIEQLIQSSRLELYQVIGIGIVVLLVAIILILLLATEKKNREKLQALKDFTEEKDRTEQRNSTAVNDIAKRLDEVAKSTAQGNERLDAIDRTLANINKPRPSVDHMKEFLGRVNGITAVNAPDQWSQSLMEYRPEFLKYDAIQRWFSREGGIGDPLFAVCSVTSSNGSQLCLIPSCYDTTLASGDLQIAYDVIKPMNGERIRTYKIDRAAVLEPYGFYFRIVSRGQITLLP